MSKYQELLGQFQEAAGRLKEVLEEKKTEIVCDSAIKRFELSFDLCWKMLKAKLDEEKGIIVRSPKDCIRESFQQGFIQHDLQWLELVNLRNLTVHTYDEKLAEKIYQDLPNVLSLYEKLLDSIQATT